MSKHIRRISAIVISGALVITSAIVVRKQIATRRANAIKATASADQAAAEREMVSLHDAARAAPHNKQAQWDLVNFYLKYNLIDKAADQLAAIIRVDPTDLDAQLKLGGILLAVDQYPAAEFYYRESTKLNPKNLLAWQGLCATLIKQRRYFEAAIAGNRALALDKNNTDSRLLHATALLDFVMQFPIPLSHTGDLVNAYSELLSLTKDMPNSADAFYQLGRSEQGLQKRKESIEHLERAHQLAPNNADLSELLALSYRIDLRDDKALKVLEDAAAVHPDDPGINDMLGRLLLDSTTPGAHERALDAFKKAVKGAPYDAKFTEHLGSAYDKLHDLPNARLALERSTQLNQFRSPPFQKLSLVYTRLGETKLAKQAAVLAVHTEFNEQQLNRLLDLTAKHPEDVNLHLVIADRYRDMKMSTQARDEYLLVLKLDPKNKRVPKEYLAASNATRM